MKKPLRLAGALALGSVSTILLIVVLSALFYLIYGMTFLIGFAAVGYIFYPWLAKIANHFGANWDTDGALDTFTLALRYAAVINITLSFATSLMLACCAGCISLLAHVNERLVRYRGLDPNDPERAPLLPRDGQRRAINLPDDSDGDEEREQHRVRRFDNEPANPIEPPQQLPTSASQVFSLTPAIRSLYETVAGDTGTDSPSTPSEAENIEAKGTSGSTSPIEKNTEKLKAVESIFQSKDESEIGLKSDFSSCNICY